MSDTETEASFQEEPPLGKKKSKKSKNKKSKKRISSKKKKQKVASDVGLSRVERLAKRIEDRQNDRIEITLPARKAFVKMCHAKAKGRDEVYRISFDELTSLKKETKKKVEAKGAGASSKKIFGFRDVDVQLLQVFETAEDMVQESDIDDWFYYQDFNTTFTKVIPTYPWMRGGGRVALFWLFLYYIFTPILFCSVKDTQICPNPSEDIMESWLTATYYASTTLSTVGYGDFSPDVSTWYGAIIGTLFMTLSNIVLIVIFNAAFDLEFFQKGLDTCAKYRLKSIKKHEFLHKKINRFKRARYFQVFFYFLIVNLVGCVVHILLNSGTDSLTDPDFPAILRGLYWAVQTTTTIGYGDLDASLVSESRGQKIFLIFYLILSTAFVGQAFGLLRTLRDDIEDTRRKFAWGRRNVSKALIKEIVADDDDQVDQYEFVVASLVQLNKASAEDIKEIMNKFRSLANGAETLSGTKILAAEQASEAELKHELGAKFAAEL